ncbi:MAG: hypothetical protein FWE94_07315, partial [Coriobacteriia bacterium]|nr:hypothetical protein [Coriobacteriia bacterium]
MNRLGYGEGAVWIRPSGKQRARLSVLLCVALVLGALPGAAWAGGARSDGGAAPAVAAADG